MSACDACLARTELLVGLAGCLDRTGAALLELLALANDDLVAAIAGRRRDAVRREHARHDLSAARERSSAAGVAMICRCRSDYPAALRELDAPPAVLHIAGRPELIRGDAPETRSAPAVALVGARSASPYGLDAAHALGRGLAAAGLSVVSGMARGIDSAAHQGALEAGGATIAVLAGGPERPYPASARVLHARIRSSGAVISELPPGTATRRWMFPARNRLIAGLSAMTVVVEARPGSGALLTAEIARQLERPVGAVPGRISSPLAHGPHQLIAAGARLISGPEAVLDAVHGLAQDSPAGAARARARSTAHRRRLTAGLPGPQRSLLQALAEGQPAEVALRRAGLATETGLAALAALELAHLIRREPGGRWGVRAG